MPLVDDIQFANLTSDMHVLRGQPVTPLSQLLDVNWTPSSPGEIASGTLAQYFAQHPNLHDVEVEFRPLFHVEENGDVLENFGIHIQKTTGNMVVDLAPPPEPAPHNFIVEATVTKNVGGIDPQKIKPAFMRFQVHRSVARIWPTPQTLSIRRTSPSGANPTPYRFTVRAEFDDGVVADITESGRYKPKPDDAECFDGNVVIIPATLAAGASREVTIVTTPEWNSVEGKGTIAALPPWDDPATTVPQAELISGHPRVLDGTLPVESVPNLLFIAAGFAAADQPAFEAITNTLVHRLRTDPQLRPYPYLASAMNFWRIPIVAREPGVCVRIEVYPFEKDGQLFALPVQAPEPPPEHNRWRLRHLLYVAGLPMPGDKVGQVTIDKIRERWALTLRPSYVPLLNDKAVVSDFLVDAWQRCAGRTFIDEVDNFPAVAVGRPPEVGPTADAYGMFEYDSRRGGGLDYDTTPPNIVELQSRERKAFFERVTAKPKSGKTLALADAPDGIGHLWAEMRNSFAFDQRTFVMGLCNMPTGHIPFGRGAWSGVAGLIIRPTLRVPSDIALVTNETTLPGLAVVKDPARNALKLQLPPLDGMELLDQAWQTVAHEIGHAFGLGDEYALVGKTRMPGSLSSVDYSNLMAADKVLAADGAAVDLGKVKWNWPRIRAASLITAPIRAIGNEAFEVPVAPKSGFRFKAGDAVLFRQRARLKIFAVDLLISGECKVESVSQDGSTVVVSRTAGSLDLPHLFLPGSILYAPLRAPPELQPFRPYLTLVSPLAERIMKGIGGTLSGKVCNQTDEAVYGARVQAPVLPTNPPIDIQSNHELPRLVGVYYGGSEYACGVVHPAGTCQMRNGFNAYTHFCHVCQYTLVDRIDPEQHGAIDRDHAKFYTL